MWRVRRAGRCLRPPGSAHRENHNRDCGVGGGSCRPPASIQADVEGLSIPGWQFLRGRHRLRPWPDLCAAGQRKLAPCRSPRAGWRGTIFAVRLAGTMSSSDQGLAADLRAEAATMSVQDLVHHWPVTVAGNARTGLRRNITRARLDRLVAEFRMRGEDGRACADGRFRELDSTYVDGMSPIRDASASCSWISDGMHLAMAEGTVDPGGAPISLAGSWIEISDFNGAVTPADIRLKATVRWPRSCS